MKKYIFLSLSLLLFFVSCKKLERDNPAEAEKLTVSTSAIIGNSSTVTTGGKITYSGAHAITARGVCWNTAPNPSITDNHTTDGAGIGEFVSSVTGLAGNTEYYVRAYATNNN